MPIPPLRCDYNITTIHGKYIFDFFLGGAIEEKKLGKNRMKKYISLIILIMVPAVLIVKSNRAKKGILSSPFFQSSPSRSAHKTKNSTQRVIVALGSAPRTLDPRKATDANGMRITDLLFQSLVRVGPKGEILPSIAQSWSYQNKVYTFYLHPHITFSNGRPLAKEDLLFSFSEYAKNSPFASAFQIIESVKVTKNKNFILTLKLKQASAKFLNSDLPVLKILPKKEILSNEANFQKNPIGSGPFKLKSQSPNEIILSTRLPSSTLNGEQVGWPQPKIDEVVFKIIRDEFTRTQKIRKGEVDIAQSELSFQKVEPFLKEKNRFQVFRKPGLSTTYLLLNLKDECFKHKEARKAIMLSIDRSQIIQFKLKGFAQPAVTLLNPNNFFFNPQVKNLSYDLQKSQNLFKSLLPVCKKTFSFKTSNARSAIQHAKVLALQLKRAGWKIRMESFEWGTFYGDLNAGGFEIALLKWVGVVDPDIYRVAFHSKEQAPLGRNRGFYSNKSLDSLLEKGILEMNPQKRRKIYFSAQKTLQKDLPFIPLWHEEQISVVKKGILNYDLNPKGDFYYLTRISLDQNRLK